MGNGPEDLPDVDPGWFTHDEPIEEPDFDRPFEEPIPGEEVEDNTE